MKTNVIRVLLILACCVANTLGQTGKRELTLEWIFGPEGRTVASVPATAWLDDGTLVILDDRRPPANRTFEKLNPATGQRQSLVDSARALADLKGVGTKVDTLPWPLAFDGAGRQALYIFKGDVFVLELQTAHFRQLTSTPAEEKSASFSPNGRRVAYVRANNLYFFDLDTNRETPITRDGSETLLNGTLSWVYWEEVFGRRDIGYWWAPGLTSDRVSSVRRIRSGPQLLRRYRSFLTASYSTALRASRPRKSSRAARNQRAGTRQHYLGSDNRQTIRIPCAREVAA